MNNIENINNNDEEKNYDFYLDPLLVDLKLVKRIGIEKSSNSLIVECNNQIILQTIHMNAFSDKTITPLKKHLSEILVEYKNKEQKQKIINSIITCINNNIKIISECCKVNI